MYFIFIAVAAAVIASLVMAPGMVDRMMCKRLQAKIADLTCTRVHLEKVRLHMMSGRIDLTGFVVENPETFQSLEAVRFKQIHIDLDMTTVLKDTIMIHEIIVIEPIVTFERQKGSNNLSILLKRSGDRIAEMDNNAGGKRKKRIHIQSFRTQDGAIHVSGIVGKRSIRLPLPDMNLTNIDTESEKQIAGKIFTEILTRMKDRISTVISEKTSWIEDKGKAAVSRIKDLLMRSGTDQREYDKG